MDRRPRPDRLAAVRALPVLIALGALVGSAVAYAQIKSGEPKVQRRVGEDAMRNPSYQPPPRPRFVEVPDAPAIGSATQFRFHVVQRATRRERQPGPSAPRRFECRLDGGDWDECGSPRRLRGLRPGDHTFAVRALNRQGRHGPAMQHRWSQLAPQEFLVEPLSASPGELMPGEPAQPLPVRIVNPNEAAIVVTSVTVGVSGEVPGCPADPNFELIPAGVSAATPLSVPAGGSVSLPTAEVSAPAIALRELPWSQDACQGIEIPLVFSGQAHG
jgi:hypothetical protein